MLFFGGGLCAFVETMRISNATESMQGWHLCFFCNRRKGAITSSPFFYFSSIFALSIFFVTPFDIFLDFGIHWPLKRAFCPFGPTLRANRAHVPFSRHFRQHFRSFSATRFNQPLFVFISQFRSLSRLAMFAFDYFFGCFRVADGGPSKPQNVTKNAVSDEKNAILIYWNEFVLRVKTAFRIFVRIRTFGNSLFSYSFGLNIMYEWLRN